MKDILDVVFPIKGPEIDDTELLEVIDGLPYSREDYYVSENQDNTVY